LCLTLRRPPEKRGIAIVGVSGGGVAHVSDIADEVGLEVTDLSAGTLTALKSLLPAFATPQNPLDTTGVVFADGDIYRNVLTVLSQDPAIGLIVASQDAPAGLDETCAAEYSGIASAVAAYATEALIPVVFMSNLSSGHHPSVEAKLANVPVLRGTRTALTAIKSLMAQSGEVSWPGKQPAPASDVPLSFVALTERLAK
jgi:acyl-CoA synthetase (NDP forming)